MRPESERCGELTASDPYQERALLYAAASGDLLCGIKKCHRISTEKTLFSMEALLAFGLTSFTGGRPLKIAAYFPPILGCGARCFLPAQSPPICIGEQQILF